MSVVTATAPHVALTSALREYLLTQITSVASLSASDVVDEFPDPSLDLKLDDNRVVLAVQRIGPARADDSLGGPNLQRVAVGTLPAGTARYEFGEVEQDLAIGVWATSRSQRDDVDEILFGFLNAPYWSTVSPALATPTTLSKAAKVGDGTLYPATMTNIWPEALLTIDTGAALEYVRVKAIGPTSFDIYQPLVKAHAATVAVAEIPAVMAQTTAFGLNLRCSAVTVNGIAYPGHYGNVARYDFDDPVHFDDAEDGAGAQRQEWRSVRNGVARIRHSRDFATTLQRQLQVALQTGTVLSGDPASPTPLVRQVFP